MLLGGNMDLDQNYDGVNDVSNISYCEICDVMVVV